MNKIIICLIIIGSALLLSCKKETDKIIPPYPEPRYLVIDAAALEYVQLPLGRYFIYKDSASASIDSVRVMKSIITKEFHPGIVTSGGGLGGGPGICPYYYQVYSLKLTLIGTPDQTWYEGISTNWNGDCVLGPDSISAVFGFPGHVFRFPFSSTGQQTLYYHFYPSLNIEGTNYTGVHEFIGNNGLPSSDSNYRETIYCWVKGIGIVKRTIKTSTTIKTSLLLRYG